MAMAATTCSTFVGRTLPTRPGNHNGGRVTMMAGKKGVRVVVTVECTEQAESGVPGVSRYTTQKVRMDRRDEDRRGRNEEKKRCRMIRRGRKECGAARKADRTTHRANATRQEGSSS
mmetsp:Transcript_5369/g.33618  ORF Transcript_5369/g.33618 Transcript_5369/m.33618 type:complete len:117 (+) Transcript_5369:71-421(+)